MSMIESPSARIPDDEMVGWEWTVDETTGRKANRFGPSGEAEVWIIAEPPRSTDKRRFILPLTFASLELGERAGEELAAAFDRVRDMRAEDVPIPESCDHDFRLERFSRKEPPWVICARCNLAAQVVRPDEQHESDDTKGHRA